MKNYHNLLRTIQHQGIYKPAAREGMPGTQSLFGYQFRHNLQEGFPLITTKKMFWKGVVIELLWFLKGDTNISYLVHHGVNIWNEDAYNYYLSKRKEYVARGTTQVSFDQFIEIIKEKGGRDHSHIPNYRWGDCGYQYGKVWRSFSRVDQIKNVFNGLKKNPESRRHIVTAIDPAHETDLALYWCHAMFQFNCRPISLIDRHDINGTMYDDYKGDKNIDERGLDEKGIPKYYLDCQLYQRSADVFLGVPFNIASYALLTHIFAEMCNMIPGEFIHTFGDVHIYENHFKQVELQLERKPFPLPTLSMNKNVKWNQCTVDIFDRLSLEDFNIDGYESWPSIKAELSTGLLK